MGFRTVLVLLSLAGTALAGGAEIGKPASGFDLQRGDGRINLYGLLEAEGTKAVVVVFSSYTCPYSLRAEKEMLPLAAAAGERGVRFVALYPNRHEDVAGVDAHAAEAGLTWPVVKDEGGVAAKVWGVEVTPTFHLVDKTGILRYRGNFARLGAAIEAVLAGEAVGEPTAPATGCTVKWAEGAVPEAPATPVAPVAPVAPPPAPVPAAPRPAPPAPAPVPALSEGAKVWLALLIGSLSSDDDTVRRSAQAGIGALGPAAVPALREARAKAEGRLAEELDRAIGRASAPPGGAGGPGGAGRGPGRFGGGAFLEMQKNFVLENVDLTPEQKAAIDGAFAGLAEREKALSAQREAGAAPESLRESYRVLMEDARKALAEILTEEQQAKLESLRRERGFGGRGGPGGAGGRR